MACRLQVVEVICYLPFSAFLMARQQEQSICIVQLKNLKEKQRIENTYFRNAVQFL